MVKLETFLEAAYRKYNKREFVSHDPLVFLYDHPDKKEREIVGLIASSLAYGRVSQILRSVETVLAPLGKSPYDAVLKNDPEFFKGTYSGFRHRFTCNEDITGLILSIKRTLEQYGSLEALFYDGFKKNCSMLEAQHNFTTSLNNGKGSYLLPSPQKGSACKRLNLFLRWMVRKDEVDPGGWDKIPTSSLIIPLDTHMLRVSKELKLTSRKQGDLKTALEITAALKKIEPDDPVKYDFALTRPGILKSCKLGGTVGT